jgi:hypothetical protein
LRSQPHSNGIEIRPLDGLRQGILFDTDPGGSSFLGIAVSEVSESQTAKLEADGSDHIREGQKFTGLSAREISFSITFYVREGYDVSHLTEQIFAFQRLNTEGDRTPEKLFVRVGGATYAPCFCSSVSVKKSNPIAGSAGFRSATVDLSFVLLGGKGSPNMTGDTHAATPIDETVAQQTAAERELQGRIEVARTLLSYCLGEEGQADVDRLLSEDGARGLQDPEKILELDPNTRLHLISGGMVSKTVMEDEKVKERLRQDIAIRIAQSERGDVAYNDRILAEAIESGDPSKLDPRWQTEYEGLRNDYNLISESVLNGNLDGDSDLFKSENSRAGDRAFRILQCGLLMRQSGSFNIPGEIGKEESAIVKGINTSISTDSSDEDLKKKFGLKTESQVRQLREGAPYESKDDFIGHMSRHVTGISAHSAWGAFTESLNKADENTEKPPQ